MPDEPLGYFLTFATYGSWLHGDVRDSKDRHHNAVGAAPRRRDDFLSGYEKRELTRAPVRFSPKERTVVEAAFAETAQHRNWTILALNVRSQHLHLVLTSIAGFTPERVMNDLKAYATRGLRRERLLGSDAKFWSRHGSTRWLWTESDVEAATIYTRDRQGADLAGSKWKELTDAVAETE